MLSTLLRCFIIVADVGTVPDGPVDLVITITDGNYTDIESVWKERGKGENGKVEGSQFGNINLQVVRNKPTSGEGNFKFCFVEQGTDEPVKIDLFQWSVFDIDQRGDDDKQGGVGVKEKLIMDVTQARFYQLWPDVNDSEVKLSCEDGSEAPCGVGVRTVFHSSTAGGNADNPIDPDKLTDKQKSRSVTFTFDNTDCWEFTYEVYCPADQPDTVYPVYMGEETDCREYSGGNFLFAGGANGKCMAVHACVYASEREREGVILWR